MKKDLCSFTMAKALKALGFNREIRYCYTPETGQLTRWNNYTLPFCYIPAPTVDQAIDWIRERYNVMVFNHVAPYVDPRDKKNRIAYIYNVKYCNRKNGWNGRVHISYGKCASYNIYAAKRMAIMEAIRWIKKNRICSKKTKK